MNSLDLENITEEDMTPEISLAAYKLHIHYGLYYTAIFPTNKINIIEQDLAFIGEQVYYHYNSDTDKNCPAYMFCVYDVVEVDPHNRICWLEKVK